MQDFMEKVRTPYKRDALVLPPSYQQGEFDSHAVDCPFPFFHDGRYYLTYVGWDGIGYRTGLASSDDLLNWRKERMLIDRGPRGSVTEYNIAMTALLRETELYAPGRLRRVDGAYLGTYHAYPRPGYESGPAVIGLCHSTNLLDWEVGEPILHPDPNCEWESGGLYKSWLLEHEGTYYIFYNAKNSADWPWVEQTGAALSKDLVHWERYAGNPIIKVGPQGSFDDLFASDPCVFQLGEKWVMFYYGNSSDRHARDSVALSDDLLHWTKSGEVLVDVGSPGSIDSRYAHKPGMIAKDGVLFHFYCAVSPAESNQMGTVQVDEIRGLGVTCSKPV